MQRSKNDQIKRVRKSGKVTGRTLMATRRKAMPQESAPQVETAQAEPSPAPETATKNQE